MASTKSTTALHSGTTLTAGAGDTTATAVDLTDGYGATIYIKITNGATGPTLPAQVQIQLSADNSEWYDYGQPFVGGTANSGVYSTVVQLPPESEHVRTVSGSNTGQNVTLDVDLSEISAI